MIIAGQNGRGLALVIRWWDSYRYFVKGATRTDWAAGDQEIGFWREKLFSRFVTYLLPICCIALIPGVLIGILQGYPFIAGFDLFAVVAIAVTVFNKKINLLYLPYWQ